MEIDSINGDVSNNKVSSIQTSSGQSLDSHSRLIEGSPCIASSQETLQTIDSNSELLELDEAVIDTAASSQQSNVNLQSTKASQFVDNDTITRFFSGVLPQQQGSQESDASSSSNTPVRRTSSRRATPKKKVDESPAIIDSVDSRWSKRQKLSSSSSSSSATATPQLKSALKKSSAASKKKTVFAEASPVTIPQEESASTPLPASPVTRSRFKALNSSVGATPRIAAPSSDKQSTSETKSLPTTPTKALTPIHGSTAPLSTGRRRSARKSLSAAIFDKGVAESIKEAEVDETDVASSNAGDDAAEDLMDEHLSVVDGSFCQDEHLTEDFQPSSIASIDAFLQLTKIEFFCGLETSFIRETSKFLTQESEATSLDYIVSMVLHYPDMEIYDYGCKELTNYIEEGRLALDAIEKDAAELQPMIFGELEEAPQEEREDMLAQLRHTAKFCRLEAKQSWYQWRMSLSKTAEPALEENKKRFIKDHVYLQEFEKAFDEMNVPATAYRDELKSKISSTKAKNAETAETESNTIVELEEIHKSQSQLLADLSRELAELQYQMKQEADSIDALEEQQVQLNQQIAEFEEQSKDLMVFDPEDLPHLRHEYKTVALTHLWKPIEVSLARYVFAYDDVIQVAFYKHGEEYSVQLSICETCLSPQGAAESGKISKISLQTNSGWHVLQTIGVNTLQGILQRYETSHATCKSWREMKLVMDQVSMTWENFKTLSREIEDCKLYCPLIQILPANEASPATNRVVLAIESIFFSSAKKLRFSLIVEFGCNEADVFMYPCGLWSWRIKKHYGNMSDDEIYNKIRTSLMRRGDLQNGYWTRDESIRVLCDDVNAWIHA